MNNKSVDVSSQRYWFVGASFDGGARDQTQRFLDEGIWENGSENKRLDRVRSIQPGDGIAIKAAYTKKKNLPFDTRGLPVSVMAIKAIGIVTENFGDGRKVKVDWTKLEPVREWYFYTYRPTLWKIEPGKWTTDALIEFAFEGKDQDIDRFRNAPFWRERFGDGMNSDARFKWTSFYEEVADKLLNYRNNREALVAAIHDISARVPGLSTWHDRFPDGSRGLLKDICPFTTMGIFNRGNTDQNRIVIATELAKFLGVKEPVPPSFEGIPVLNNQQSWFFRYADKRKPDDIDKLWSVFAEGLSFIESDEDDEESETSFIKAYDNALQVWGVKWNLSMGLYWIRPWNYPTLDGKSRHYLKKQLNIEVGVNPLGGEEYLEIANDLGDRFLDESCPVHSFPELSLESWNFKDNAESENPEGEGDDEDAVDMTEKAEPQFREPYGVDSIVDEGCFFDRERLEIMLERLCMKKNLILQGPPGTGKTWLAKRLAFALIGSRDESKVRAVQFHPNLSYEDFIRGWRPSGDGKLTLSDGPFMQMIKTAKADPKSTFVMVIEEVNRGNPAQVFGEMLTLLEADKRNPKCALELSYSGAPEECVYIPENLYVIGTMNIADRSLALVDFALRRRFAFVNLTPEIGERWRDWVHEKNGIGIELLREIEQKVLSLNKVIESDRNLGVAFQIGHSFVTPASTEKIEDGTIWFRQVIETEIGPLLDEYWFDNPGEASNQRDELLKGFK